MFTLLPYYCSLPVSCQLAVSRLLLSAAVALLLIRGLDNFVYSTRHLYTITTAGIHN